MAEQGLSGGVSVVVPAYNEEHTVKKALEKILAVLGELKEPNEVIVVDDGSSDETVGQISTLLPRVKLLRHETNRGYGASLKTAIRQARYPIVVITDADGTYPFEKLPCLLGSLANADMVVGARTGEKVAIPLVRKPAKWVLSVLANRLSGVAIPDLNSGFRVFLKEVITYYFHILPNRFSFTTTMTLAMLADGYRVRYVPIDYRKREGQSKIKPVDAIGFLILILRTVTYFNPLRIFAPIFLMLLLLAIGKSAYDIFWLKNITDTTTLIWLMSLQVLLIGLVADLVVKRDRGGSS